MSKKQRKTKARPKVARRPVSLELEIAMRDHQQGTLDIAMERYRRILSREPLHPDALHLLGVATQQLGDHKAAETLIRKAIAIRPQAAAYHSNLCVVLTDLGRFEEALAACDRSLSLQPESANTLYNRGNALNGLGRLSEALRSYQASLKLEPKDAETHNNCGSALRNLGRLDEALAAYAAALQLAPNHTQACSNLLFAMHYGDGITGQLLRDTTVRYAARLGGSTSAVVGAWAPREGRRLRVGFVSGDFWDHAVAYFVERLFVAHDRSRVEVFAYSNNAKQDAVTERLRTSVDGWRQINQLSDQAVIECIRGDAIDVLIDLSGHTAHNRLGVFAQRAAPVQAHYLGFMGTTGLAAMDYWIGDALLTPSSMDAEYTETLWRLPRVWVAYNDSVAAPAPVWEPSPDGILWLGSFNSLVKVTPATIALWARILRSLPEARLLLKAKQLADPENCQWLLAAFAAEGIPAERVLLRDAHATPGWAEHMASYCQLDIALDPIGGVSGGTTSCDALWMGVPVITKLGDRMASRMTASMLKALGREEWIAKSDEDYVMKVVELARDVKTRQALRVSQREQMRQSPLCDAEDLARVLEEAYTAMFDRWWTARQLR